MMGKKKRSRKKHLGILMSFLLPLACISSCSLGGIEAPNRACADDEAQDGDDATGGDERIARRESEDMGGRTTTDSAEIAAKPGSDRLAFMREKMARYEFFVGSREKGSFQFEKEPALRWSNPVSGVVDGTVFVWTVDGRPEVVAKCFINRELNAWCQVIQSLSSRSFVVQQDRRTLGTSSGPGIELRPARQAPAPAKTKAARLVQMRAIVRSFQVVDTWKRDNLPNINASEWQLRSLPAPLIRYESPGRNIVDGALFAFVQGTNPEAVLVLEADAEKSRGMWRYAFARLTIYALDAELDTEPVWQVPKLEVGSLSLDQHGAFFHGWHPFSRYPFQH